jgi:hypothetical protein
MAPQDEASSNAITIEIVILSRAADAARLESLP